jgi:2-hydroxychromene-2-carboxylate isomerase
MHVDFYFDFLSPYGYIGSKVIQKQPWYPTNIRYKPFTLPVVMSKSENKSPASVPAKLAWMRNDMKRTATMYGFDLNIPTPFPFSTKYLNAAVASLSEEKRFAATNLIYDKIFGKGHSGETCEEFVQTVFKEAGIELEEGWFERGYQEVTNNTEEALKKGAFGAPTMILYKDDKDEGELFWGSDRIDQLAYFIQKCK